MLRYLSTGFVLLVGLATLALALAADRAVAAPVAGVVGDGTPASCTEAAVRSQVSGGGLVTFNCGTAPVTITVLSVLTVTQPTTIDGAGLITLWGSWATRLFYVESGASLTLQSMILSHGDSGASDGGAIANHGTLNVYDSVIRRSYTANSHSGGAIFSDGPVNIVNSDFVGNGAGSAGAIFANFQNARVQIANSRFVDNNAFNLITGYGGAIWIGEQAHLTMAGGDLDGNQGRYGGALYLSPGAMVTLTTDANGGGVDVRSNIAQQSGGGIYSQGGSLWAFQSGLRYNRAMTLTNSAGIGGGIAAFDGPLALFDTTFFENNAHMGGGLYASGLQAVIDRSIFGRNIATQTGGGLLAEAASAHITVTNTSFNFNYSGGLGGGLARNNATVHVQRSSFTNNAAAVGGGGLYNDSDSQGLVYTGHLFVQDSTVSMNTAGGSQGGGLLSYGTLVLANATVVHNTNGLYSQSGGDSPFVSSSVLHNPGTLNCDGGGVTPATRGGNFASDDSCAFTDTLDQQGPGLDPLLGPLTLAVLSNRTDYHRPLPGSPLINKGLGTVPCSALDQILAQRPDTCDIGAVEANGLLPRIYLALLRR